MVELGAYWAYYSLWFNRFVKNPTNYCCEPDPKNIALGERHAQINKAKNMHFVYAAAGKDDKKVISFKPQEGDYPPVRVPIRSVDGLINEQGIKRLDVLHMDVQGAELSAIEGAEDSIRKGLIRFVIVSTHHYLVSGDVLTHEKCIEKIKRLGGHIIAEHAIHESFSGDGLVVASFFDADKDMSLTISENRMQDSLFRSYNQDMAILIETYERLRKS
jgi:FkbM family methyltransferase